LLRYGLPLIGMNVATFIATFGDRYFLRAQGDMTAVGLYTLSYQFGFLLMSLGYIPFSMMWEPARFEIAKRPDRDAVFARVFVYLNVALLTLAVAMSLFVSDFLSVMTAPAFHTAANLVPVILLAYVLQGWSSFQEVGLLVRERTELVTLSNWLAAITAVIGYVLLIPRWMAAGAAWATVLAFAVRTAVTYVASQRLWPVRYEWSPVAKLVVIAVAFAVAGVVTPRPSLAWSVLLHGVLFAGYLAALWNVDILTADDRLRVRQTLRSPRRLVSSLVT
jgi:O-antigen/teichoic acid export membrane protein